MGLATHSPAADRGARDVGRLVADACRTLGRPVTQTELDRLWSELAQLRGYADILTAWESGAVAMVPTDDGDVVYAPTGRPA